MKILIRSSLKLWFGLGVFSMIFVNQGAFAQSPEKMSYQAVIRTTSDALVVNQAVGMRLSILQGTPTGAPVYTETHNATTNANGLISIEAGAGNPVFGVFANIEWSNGPFFLKTETDPNGGTNYTITGTTQLLSVPYALYAKNSTTAANGLPSGGTEGQVLSICNGVPCWIDCGTCPAVVLSIDCNSAVISGSLTENIVASGVTFDLSYTGGNGGTNSGQTIQSSGVSGLTATLNPGTINNGNGILTFSVSGTAATSGTASFEINIGGQNCTVDVEVLATSGSSLYPPNYVHCNPSNPTAVVDVTNPVTGKTWMDRNLGANRAAISSSDAEAFGSLFQWGRGADGHQCVNRYPGDGVTTSSTTTVLSTSDVPGHGDFILSPNLPNDWRSPQNINLWQGLNGVNNPCPSGYRVPTDLEIDEEKSTWSSLNAVGAFNSSLKLSHGGGRANNGGVNAVNVISGYWTSTDNGGTASRILYISSNAANIFTSNRGGGSAIRCIKGSITTEGTINNLDCNSATNTGSLVENQAANGVSKTIAYTGGNGNPHNGQVVVSTGVSGLTATLSPGTFANGNGTLIYTISGTPSSAGSANFNISIGGRTCSFYIVVSAEPTPSQCGLPTTIVDVLNPLTGKTWMDRNLGASQAAIDLYDEDAYGHLFQWGRDADGHECRTSATTAVLSTTDQPNHADFILSSATPNNWRTMQNDNLWQGVNGVNNPCPSGYRLPSSTELNAEANSWDPNFEEYDPFLDEFMYFTDYVQGAMNSALKCTPAGSRNGSTGSISGEGFNGNYWSSTVSGTGSINLEVENWGFNLNAKTRARGASVRCIKN